MIGHPPREHAAPNHPGNSPRLPPRLRVSAGQDRTRSASQPRGDAAPDPGSSLRKPIRVQHPTRQGRHHRPASVHCLSPLRVHLPCGPRRKIPTSQSCPEPILKNSATPRLRGGTLAGPSKRPTSMLRSAQIPAVGKQRRSSTLGDPSHTPRRPLTPSSTPHPPYTHKTPPAHS